MVKTLKAFGVVAGIVSFLFCTSAGLHTINLADAPGWTTGLGVFFIGIGFFAGPLVIIVALSAPDSAAQPVKTKQLKQTTPMGQVKSAPKPAEKTTEITAEKPKTENGNGIAKIYVGNISPEASENDIKTAFSGFGEIKEVRVIKDREGKSKGYAFVEMPQMNDAKNAIESLNGKDLGGRALKVNFAKAKPKTSRKPRRQSNSKSARPQKTDAQMVDWDA